MPLPTRVTVYQLNLRESITAQTTRQICLPERREKEKIVLEAYRKHAAERAEIGVVPKPLSAEQVAGLIELLKQPPAGEEDFLLELLSHRVPPGVDEAAYLKAGFLSALARGEASSPLIDRKHAVKLLGTMLGGYNIATLVELLDDE